MLAHARPHALFSAVIVAVLLLLLLLIPHYAFAADAVVGNGTPASCTESAFDTALATAQSTSGTITFNCGTSPLTITISGYKQISAAVTIDGADLITFNGNNTSSFFQVLSNADLTLEHLTVTNGINNGIAPLENFGRLMLTNVAVYNNDSDGSAVLNQGSGVLTVRDSNFAGNSITGGTAQQGAAIRNNGGTATVEDSIFATNAVNGNDGVGGAIANLNGTLIVSSTFFTNNFAFDGAVIFASAASTTTITDTTFSFNRGGYGGAIMTRGTVDISDSVFEQNYASIGEGGAIQVVTGTLNVTETFFTGNHSDDSGGAIEMLDGVLTLTSSHFVGSRAAIHGGAISCDGGNFTITGTTFVASESMGPGGAIYSTCSGLMTNDTLTNNTAVSGGGGAIHQGGDAGDVLTLNFLTVIDNTADFGSGIYNNNAGSSLTISNSIVTANGIGNCDGVITSGGYNLTNNTTCGAFVETGDVQNGYLPLENLADYGGPTQTMPSVAGSDALNHIPAAECDVDNDQRGYTRPQGTNCDSGAVEGTKEDGLPNKTYLPLASTGD